MMILRSGPFNCVFPFLAVAVLAVFGLTACSDRLAGFRSGTHVSPDLDTVFGDDSGSGGSGGGSDSGGSGGGSDSGGSGGGSDSGGDPANDDPIPDPGDDGQCSAGHEDPGIFEPVPVTFNFVHPDFYLSGDLVIADVNNDGRSDILKAHPSDVVSLFLAEPDGRGFNTEQLLFISGIGGGKVRRIQVGNFNVSRPGLELAMLIDDNSDYPRTMKLVIADLSADGTSVDNLRLIGEGSRMQHVLEIGDFNNSGFLDIAITSLEYSNQQGVFLFRGKGDGSFHDPDFFSTDFTPEQGRIGNFSYGLYRDLLIARGPMAASLLGGSNGFNGLGGSHTTIGDRLGIEVGDFTGNGIDDLALAAGYGFTNSIDIVTIAANGTFNPGQSINTIIPGCSNPQRRFTMAVGDLTGNLSVDLAVAFKGPRPEYMCRGGAVFVYEGNGDGTFSEPFRVNPAPNDTSPWCPGTIHIHDFDNDGKADLLLTNGAGYTDHFRVFYGK